MNSETKKSTPIKAIDSSAPIILDPWRQTQLQELPIYVIIVFYSITVVAISYWIGAEEQLELLLYPQSVIAVFISSCFVFFIVLPFWLFIRRERSPIGFILVNIRFCLQRPWYIAAVLLFLATMTIFLGAFSSLKNFIPLIHAYDMDVMFAQFDQWLHFGVQPWRITHHIFSTPISTGVINVFYGLWFIALWTTWLWYLFAFHRPRDRMQFMLSFLLVWIISGSIVAIALSSVGPCFFGDVVDGPDIYAPLMERLKLQQAALNDNGSWLKLWALISQDRLWESYSNAQTNLGSGISAMPSLHVGTSILIALGTWRIHWILGICMWIYAFLVQLGSVHLAWHYAIDGYLSAILTIVIWKLTDMYIKTYYKFT